MKLAALLLMALATLTFAEEDTIIYVDEDGNVHIDPLSETSPTTFGVDIKKMHFMLYTQGNIETPYELVSEDIDNLKASPFDSSVKTKIVVHGYGSSYTAEPLQTIKNAYLAQGKYNIILVDYKKYNMPYIVAVGSSKDVANKAVSLINFLMAYGNLQEKDIHVIGHSLGAHIAGFIGQGLNFEVPRITGLDPAGPLFTGAIIENRLSDDDAVYIDSIHTSNRLGIGKALGTSDFFANGGSNQPACMNAGIGQELIGNCDHAQSFKYFVETIATDDRYPAKQCDSEKDAKNNVNCRDSTAFMGEEALARSPAGFYYVPVA